jgi:hypothetical protein
MSTVALPAIPRLSARVSVWPLARTEAIRYARHPLFLLGFVAALLAGAGERGPMELDFQVIPSFFIGVLGVVVAARLTVSTRPAGPVVDAAPTSITKRTAALCLACAVPATAGLVAVLVHRAFVLASPLPEWHHGTYSGTDPILITMVIPVVACAGGPLLGVAAGRWLRFPASTLLVMVLLLLWSWEGAYVPEQRMPDPATPLARTLHMLTPYTAWGGGTYPTGGNESYDTLSSVVSYTGAPTWYAVWATSLCVLAAAAALLKGAHGRTRSRIVAVASGALVVAVLALTMAATHGNQQLFQTDGTGTQPIVGTSP